MSLQINFLQHRNLLINPDYLGPMKVLEKNVKMERIYLRRYQKHWYEGGKRSLAAAVSILRQGKIIAIPTDTIYGLAGLAQSEKSVAKIYDIKGRDLSKPLAICVWDVSDISNWAETDDLPPNMLESLFPGPVTVILKRKPSLNPSLNPDVESVGIRVPNSPFLRSVVRLVGQPLALTSANESNKRSTLYPEEFEALWPNVSGIFYTRGKIKDSEIRRCGSTIVDLTQKGCFKIIRVGRALHSTRSAIEKFGWYQLDAPKPKVPLKAAAVE